MKRSGLKSSANENEEDKNKLIKALENDRVFYLWAVNSDENTFESIVDKLPNILNKKDKGGKKWNLVLEKA